jgi:hypothetical protein
MSVADRMLVRTNHHRCDLMSDGVRVFLRHVAGRILPANPRLVGRLDRSLEAAGECC